LSETTGVKNYEKINLHAPTQQRGNSNATPEIFYQKDTTDPDNDEEIGSGIEEDLGESDVDVALEPVQKPAPP
jgi:hypothetical protein